MRQTTVIEGLQFASADFPTLVRQGKPYILKGALQHCPLVIAGRESKDRAMSHLLSYDSEQPLLNYIANAETSGRFFYNPEMDGFNFSTEYSTLASFFENLRKESRERTGTAYYIGSAELADHFPNLLESDSLVPVGDVFTKHPPRVGIWLGNKTTAATHFDVSNNIAACVVGRRRFTLFPPEQIENLYPGPLEPTPGGQVVSMFDPQAPDFRKYPKAHVALEHAEVAELEAGDVLVYPAMWWHQVEALDDFNVLINYWWNEVPSFVDDPMNTLLHALLSVRDRPDKEKEAWRALFDFYVFGNSSGAREHLPEQALGSLAPLNETSARRLRAKLLNKFNR